MRDTCAFIIAAFVLAHASHAQTPPAAQGSAQAAAPAAKFKQEELDQMLAPIALYPDSLVTQVLMASTYPLELVEAARWREQNASLQGSQLEDALKNQSWDESVKSLTAFPEVLNRMNKDLGWTQKLGDAFLGQQAQVLDTIQSLRKRAQAAGNLKSNEQQKVEVQTQANTQVIVIEPANPQVVYVPTYQPTVVYGAWPYPAYPPYYPTYWAPVGAAFVSGFFWGAGIAAGAALWGGCNWGNHDVNINVNRYNNFNRTNIQNTNWQHNTAHRGGVAYRDNGARQQFGQADARATQAREQFRGREGGSLNQANLSNRSGSNLDNRGGGNLQNRGGAGAQDRSANLQNRSGSNLGVSSSPQRDFSSRSNSSFDPGRGSDARSASARGNSSLGASGGSMRASGGGGGARAGGGGGGRAGGGGGGGRRR